MANLQLGNAGFSNRTAYGFNGRLNAIQKLGQVTGGVFELLLLGQNESRQCHRIGIKWSPLLCHFGDKL